VRALSLGAWGLGHLLPWEEYADTDETVLRNTARVTEMDYVRLRSNSPRARGSTLPARVLLLFRSIHRGLRVGCHAERVLGRVGDRRLFNN